jgi:hypothetical protein
MNNLTGAQAACLPFARREAQCEHTSGVTHQVERKKRQPFIAPLERADKLSALQSEHLFLLVLNYAHPSYKSLKQFTVFLSFLR